MFAATTGEIPPAIIIGLFVVITPLAVGAVYVMNRPNRIRVIISAALSIVAALVIAIILSALKKP